MEKPIRIVCIGLLFIDIHPANVYSQNDIGLGDHTPLLPTIEGQNVGVDIAFQEIVKAANFLSLVPLLAILFLFYFLFIRTTFTRSLTRLHLRITNVIMAGIIYAASAFMLYQVGMVVLIMAIFYAIASMLLMKSFIDAAEKRKSMNFIEFCQMEASSSLGTNYGSFHHVFFSHDHVLDSFKQALITAFKTRLSDIAFKEFKLKDVDRDLKQPETRIFWAAEAPRTIRRTGFMLLFAFTQNNAVQGVRWWVFVQGERDANKIFWRYIFSPLAIPFIFLPYWRREYDPLEGLDTIYSGFFNIVDIVSTTRELHFVTYETLVETLDQFEIDTSDLKQQRGNILNINVSGGQSSFGAVAQGAFNKITSTSIQNKP